jgi:predicted transcriptional regulator
MSDKESDMSSTRLTIRLDTKLRKRLRRKARQQGKRDSEIAREALEAYCPEQQEKELTCYDIAMKVGLIGAAKNAPPDLSSNKKYFEGFGKSR